MANGSQDNGVVGQIIVGVVVGLAVAGTSPWWWQELIVKKETTPTPTSTSTSIPSARISFKFKADNSFQPTSGNQLTLQLIQPNGEFHAVFRTTKPNRDETWLWGYQYNRDGSLQAKFGMIDSNNRFIDPWVSTSEKIYYAKDSANSTTVSGINNKYNHLEAMAKFVSVE